MLFKSRSRHVDRGFSSSKQISEYWTTYQHSSSCRFLLRWSWRGERRLNFGDFLFLEWGSGVSPVSSSVRPSVLSGKTRVCAKNHAESRKKNETADDGGGCVSPRPTARYPNLRPRPTPPTAKYGIAKNGELLGPKVKGRVGYSKVNI